MPSGGAIVSTLVAGKGIDAKVGTVRQAVLPVLNDDLRDVEADRQNL